MILKDRVTLPTGICAATALTGVILVVFQPGAQADATGIALTVAGVGACALYTVLSSKVLADASSLSIVLLQQAAALIFALALLAGMFINLIPVFGLTASYLVLGERLARRQWLGVSLVLAAVTAIARFQVSQGQVATRPAPTSASPTD